jgi:ABC-type protease/lipase transport system fused ATPase/permease subunit
MRESGIAVALLSLLLVAYLIYTFDPWVGIAAGVAVLIIAVVLAVATQTSSKPKKRAFASGFPWDEEERSDNNTSEP